MDIKNATELTPRQWYLFLKLVTKYFSKEVVQSNKNPVLNKVKMQLLAQGYAETVLTRIKNGTLTSFVRMNYSDKEVGLVPIAFITGYLDRESNLLKLCHLYRPEDTHEATTVKYLFRPLSELADAEGIAKVYTESDLLMPNLTDSLETLGLEQGELDGTRIPYSRNMSESEVAEAGVKYGKRIAFNRNTRRQ